MNDVRMPIETIREGNKITKVCIEDVYKIVNRIYEAIDKAYNKSVDILEEKIKKEISVPNEEDSVWEGYLIQGVGVSQPCIKDTFDEEIGNNIAFMKAKLNANIKKHNFICQIYNSIIDALITIDRDLEKVDSNIRRDLNGIRAHNPKYLSNIEFKLGI